MIHRIFLILLLLIISTDTYIYRSYIKPRTTRRWLRIAWWLPSIVISLCLAGLLVGDNFTSSRILLTGIYMTAYLILIVPKCLFTLLSLVGRGLKRFSARIPHVMDGVALVTACLSLFLLIYGTTLGWHRYEVKEVEFRHPDLPDAFDGYRMVQISDWHLGTIARYPSRIAEAVALINSLKADLIVFTGDLVNNEAVELDGLDSLLTSLSATDGVISILGNHDYGTYRQWESEADAQANLDELKRRERAFGWHLLLNEHRLIVREADTLAIVGVENDGLPPFPSLGDLPKATSGAEPYFKILLSHDPTHWRRRVLPETDIPLTLSGHTHAMQFRIGNWSPASWFYPEWSGFYHDEGGRTLYVNQGLGGVMLPFRLGAWPEVTLFTLRK